MRPEWIGSVGHERPDHGRREPKVRDGVAGDHGPEPVGGGGVWRALVQHQLGAKQQRARDRPWTHHPTEIREPEEAVAGAEVEAVREILRALDREAAMDVHGTLRPA